MVTDEDKNLVDDVMDRMKAKEEEEHLLELRNRLLRGKWFTAGAEAIIKRHPVIYDENETWWIWNRELRIWEEKDEIDILIHCKKTLDLLGDTTIKHSVGILKALMELGRQKKPSEPPLSWVQFGNEFVDITDGTIIPSSPLYFSTNTIPYRLGVKSDTPTIDKLFEEWVGKEHVQMLYEIIAYSVYRDYPIHRIFCLVGSGANGKTRFMKIVEKFIGDNKASVTLKRLHENNFALYPLYKKLVCFVGETTHHRLESTEVLKALSGQDPITFEAKGKNAFTGQNYAKLIIGTNTLPPSDDTSRGWYRRWLIINFPNEFEEGEDVLKKIPEIEYSNLARKCMDILPKLLKDGKFSGEGTIDERRKKYVSTSTPIKMFLETYFDRDIEGEVRYADIYNEFLAYLNINKFRRISKKEFTTLLEDEGISSEKQSMRRKDGMGYSSVMFVYGIKRKTMATFGQVTTPTNPDNPDVPVACEKKGVSLGKRFLTETMGLSGLSESEPKWTDFTYKEQENGFPYKQYLVDVMKSQGGIIHTDELFQIFPGEITKVEKYINELKSDGVIYEPTKGSLRLL